VPRIVTGTLPGDEFRIEAREGKGSELLEGSGKCVAKGQFGSLAARPKEPDALRSRGADGKGSSEDLRAEGYTVTGGT
jgi:hypothetical protein